MLAIGSHGCSNLNNINPYFDSGLDKSKSGNTQGLIADYTKALKIEPNKAGLFYFRGIERSKSEEYEGAIADFDNTIEIKPNTASLYVNRGIAKDMLNDTEDACTDYRMAADLGMKKYTKSKQRVLINCHTIKQRDTPS